MKDVGCRNAETDYVEGKEIADETRDEEGAMKETGGMRYERNEALFTLACLLTSK